MTVPQFECGSFGAQPAGVWASARGDLVRTPEELLEVVRESTAMTFLSGLARRPLFRLSFPLFHIPALDA